MGDEVKHGTGGALGHVTISQRIMIELPNIYWGMFLKLLDGSKALRVALRMIRKCITYFRCLRKRFYQRRTWLTLETWYLH